MSRWNYQWLEIVPAFAVITLGAAGMGALQHGIHLLAFDEVGGFTVALASCARGGGFLDRVDHSDPIGLRRTSFARLFRARVVGSYDAVSCACAVRQQIKRSLRDSKVLCFLAVQPVQQQQSQSWLHRDQI